MRIGKIARLPVALREELNRRRDDNIPARDLLPWLNDLPEVKEILKSAFNGEAINEQNLSNWRRGGFAEWQARENLLFKLQLLSEEAEQVEALASGTADHVARLIAIHFALVLSPKAAPVVDGDTADITQVGNFTSIAQELGSIRYLCQLTRAITALRRGDHSAARLKLLQQQAASGTTRQPKAASPAKTETPHPSSQASKPSAACQPQPTPAQPAIKVNQACSSHEFHPPPPWLSEPSPSPWLAGSILDPAANPARRKNPQEKRAVSPPAPAVLQAA